MARLNCDCTELLERHEHDDECCPCPCHDDEGMPDYDQLGKDDEIHREQVIGVGTLPMMNPATHARLKNTLLPDGPSSSPRLFFTMLI